MAWVAVDKDGTEKIFETIPARRKEVERAIFGTLRRIIRKAYSKNNYKKWASMWSSNSADPLPEGAIKLPKGSIKKLIGKDLTWEDDPVELMEE